ncbi:MAG: thioredoxin domain-containing protein [Solirubrobacteraceae bacterium]
MASRKDEKQSARARRLAEGQARAERERRQRRNRMLGGIVVGAVVVVIAAVALSSGGTPSGLAKNDKAQKAVVAQVGQLLSGIPQSGARLGNPKAPVVITYYGDLQCPSCADFTLNGGFTQLVANDVRSGKVQILYRAFETATTDPATFQTQQAAALAAGGQQHFWNFTELFYRQQGAEGTGYVTESYLDGLARQIPGLKYSAWLGARNSPTLVGQIQADKQAGTAVSVQGTPTLIAQGPKGKSQVPGAIPSYSQLEAAIKSVT